MNDLNLLQQLIARWKAKSPTFFKVITVISSIVAFVSGIPALLVYFNVTLPEPFLTLENKTIGIAAAIAAIISSLTVATPQTKQILSDINSNGTSQLNKTA